MFFITIVTVFLLLPGQLLLITPTHSARTSSSPKYLFSSESNIDEETFVGSRELDERFEKDEIQEISRHSRARRAVDSVPVPTVKASQDLCEHAELVIQWTDRDESITSKGSIIALCRKGTDKNGRLRTPLVFVSYDHGSSWENVTNKFYDAIGTGSSKLSIETYSIVQKNPKFIVFPDKPNNRIFYTNDGLRTVKVSTLTFEPDAVSINPENPSFVIAVNNNQIYLSKDGSQTYTLLGSIKEVGAYYWGSKAYGDNDTDIFVEGKLDPLGKTQGFKLDCKIGSAPCEVPQSLTDNSSLMNGDITDFLVMNQYMFCTKERKDKNGVDLFVKYTRKGDFVKAKIRTKSPLRELFVYDVTGGVVMLVANHRKNETNLYASLNISGTEYSLSLPRVLYHNPHTDVSSHWLRQAVSYRFVDVRRVQGLPSVYFATQLTIGPVGGRYLISMMTFDKGGVWQRIQGPRKDKYDQLCFYPVCSLHVNLFYGSIYRYSRTTPLMSRKSARGLIMTTGVLGANLKITPDTYISRDGGKSFDMVLTGKRRFAFGDHGGFVVASDFTQSGNLQYSYDIKTFHNVALVQRGTVQIKKILTEPGERAVVFVVMGTVNNKWQLFQINATRTLGPTCKDDNFKIVNVSGVGVGGCSIARVRQRNSSIRCLTGYNNAPVAEISYANCRCRRQDYRCDFLFEPTTTGGCRLRDGVTLLPPRICPEMSFYNQSRGYVKIDGRNCNEDFISRSNFAPVETPCPITKLNNVTIDTTPKMQNGVVPVPLNGRVVLTANLSNGYLPYITFTWTTVNGNVFSGLGQKFSSFSQVMTTAGASTVSLKISNSRSNINKVVSVVVQRMVNEDQIVIEQTPSLPSIGEKVDFVTLFSSDAKMMEMGTLKYKWMIGKHHIETSSPFFSAIFNKTGETKISVSVRNMVSHGQKSHSFQVTKDLKVKNVKLSIRNGLILVQWDLVVEPVYNVAGYQVMYRKEKGPFFMEAVCRKNTRECLIFNVTAYTKYQVKVAVVVQKGYGPPSDVQTIMTPAKLPSVPTKVKLNIEQSTEVRASWQPPEFANGKLSAYSYKFYKKINGATAYKLSYTQLKKTFPNLDVDEDYHFEVAAVNQMGTGPYSEAISVRTGVDRPTQPPTNLQFLQVTQTTARLGWGPPPIKSGSLILFSPKGYNIYVVDDKGNLYQVNSTSDRQTFLTGLLPFTKYTYAVRAFVSHFEGPAARTTFTTRMAPPSPPSNFVSVSQFPTSVTFSWTAPPHKAAMKFTYEVYQRSPAREHPVVTTNDTKATVDHLKPYTNYSFAAKTVNSDNTRSSYSEDVVVRTKEYKPDAPAKVEVTDRWPTSSSVRVLWEPPTSPNGIITKYKVKWFISSVNGNVEEKSVSGSTTFLDIDHLKQETKYRFEVVAFTKVGSGIAKFAYFSTRYYPFGSEHIIIPFQVPKTAVKLSKVATFKDKFITILTRITKIAKERFADVRLNTEDNDVEFEVVSNEHQGETSNEIISEMMNVKRLLAPSFDASGDKDFTKANSVKSEQHPGQPSTGKQNKSSSNTAVIVGIVCAAAVIIVILVAALVLVFRRYRKNSLYDKFDNQVQYNHDSGSTSVDGEVEVRRPSHKHRNKDIETVPLADADELT